METTRRVQDPLFLDRIRLEFAGVCNQVFAADGLEVKDLEALLKVCRKTAGYISLGLEERSHGNPALSEETLRNNPLVTIFRAGFGLALQLKWEVERWMGKAWFIQCGLGSGFWDEAWGGILSGLLQKRPRLFAQPSAEDSLKDFETLSEIEECRIAVRRMKLLDRLLKNLTARYHWKEEGSQDPPKTFYALLFTYWARQELSLNAGFEPLSEKQVKELFRGLRKSETGPPFRISGSEKGFIEALMAHSTDLDLESARVLRETLSLIWEKFAEEYALVEVRDLDGRYLKFISTSA